MLNVEYKLSEIAGQVILECSIKAKYGVVIANSFTQISNLSDMTEARHTLLAECVTAAKDHSDITKLLSEKIGYTEEHSPSVSSKLIETPASEKQIRFLERNNISFTSGITSKAASALIDSFIKSHPRKAA